MAVPIVKMIGLGMGMLLWGMANLIMGWSSGTFGLFNLRKEEVPKPILNYLGVVAALLSIAIYVFVKTDVSSTVAKKKRTSLSDDEVSVLINGHAEEKSKEEEEASWVDKLNNTQKKILGILLSLVSGVFYGVNFDPPQYLMDHGGSKNGLDYVFSHFSGILVTSTFYMLLYCALMKNKPIIYPQSVLPGFFSGFLWAVADICW